MGLSQSATGVLSPLVTFAGFAALLLIAHRIYLIVYRLWFHPLKDYPGPKLWAASNIPFFYHDKYSGNLLKVLAELHEKYGPEVRIGSDRLLLDGAIAWPEVYMRRANLPEFSKNPAFFGQNGQGIISANRENHRRHRRAVAHAFSAQALADQEQIVLQYIDLFIQRLRGFSQEGKPVNMVNWLNFLAFDIIGDMAFGEPFGALQGGDYHPWVAKILDFAHAISFNHLLRTYPLLQAVVMPLFVKSRTFKQMQEHTELSKQKTEKRIAVGADARTDFLTYILRNNGVDGKGLTHEEVLVNSRSFINAGSETTSTALSGIVHMLCHSPEVRKHLVDEIRSNFQSEDEITIRSTSSMPYLFACIEEGLRLYAPLPMIPPRVSPGDYVNGKFVPAGSEIYISADATFKSPKHFTDADQFRPQRWLPPTHPLYDTRYANDKRDVVKPFSAGSRDCIGKNLAYAEMRVTLSKLYWNFDIEELPGQADWIERQRVFLVRQKGTLMVKLTPVKTK